MINVIIFFVIATFFPLSILILFKTIILILTQFPCLFPQCLQEIVIEIISVKSSFRPALLYEVLWYNNLVYEIVYLLHNKHKYFYPWQRKQIDTFCLHYLIHCCFLACILSFSIISILVWDQKQVWHIFKISW